MRPARAERITLAVFVDALGWRLLESSGWMADALPHRNAVETVFGYSSACDPTILTGVMPQEHGHFAFYTYAPDRSPFTSLGALRFLPAGIASRGRVRHLMSRALAPALGMRGYFQLYNAPFEHLGLFDYTERKDLYAPGGINGGQQTIFDELRRHGVTFHVSDWRQSDRVNLDAVIVAMRQARPAFAYLFLGSLDAVLHAHGTESTQAADRLAWYERELRAVLSAAEEEYHDVQILLFSDHGMTAVTDECNLIGRIERLGLRFGVDYAAVYDSTMARFWFLKRGARERIEQALAGESRGRLLSHTDLAAWGCDFAGARYGESFFLLDPGVLLNPSFMGRARLAGMHGYDPTHRDSTAAFATNVRGLRAPRRLDDLFGLMRSCAIPYGIGAAVA